MVVANGPILHQHRLNALQKAHVIGMDKMGNLAHTDHKTIIRTTITPYITVHGQHHKEAGDHLHMRQVVQEAKEQPKVKANIRHDRTIPKVKVRPRMTMAKDKPEKDNTMPKVGKAKDAGGNATIQDAFQLAESLSYKNQSADESIGEPTSFNKQRNM